MEKDDFEKLKAGEAHSPDDDDDEKEKDGSKADGQSSQARDENDNRNEREDDSAEERSSSNYQIAKNSQFDSEEDDKPESSEETEPEEVFEDLTAEESYTVVEEYVGERSSEVRKEVDAAVPESPEEAAALANAALLDEIRERLATEGEGSEEVLDKALNQVAEELELDVEKIDGPSQPKQAELLEEPVEDDEAAPIPPGLVPPTPPVPPLPPTPNVPPPTSQPEVWRSRRSPAGNLLLGGIIGYMIGRRGGRKRTEKRLLPIQEKLEHEVKNLQFAVELREQKIRRLAAEKVVREPEAAPKLTEKLKKRVADKETARSSERAEKIVEKNSDVKFGKFALPKAEILPERRQITEDTGKKPRIALEVMTVGQLLEVVDSARVEGVSVKQMYEAGRINEFGLRRVAIEYLRGRHYEKVLSVYLLPDSAETIHQNLSPTRALNINSAGQITSENAQSRTRTDPVQNGGSLISFGQNSAQGRTLGNRTLGNESNLPVLRKPPKIYPSVIGMAAGVLLALLIIVYLLMS